MTISTLNFRKWFVHLPISITKQKQSENQGRVRVCGVDPGERTFLTVCDTEGTVTEIGGHYAQRKLRVYQRQVRHLQAKPYKELNKQERFNYARARWKISNLVGDLHKKAAAFLASSYEVVYLGKLGVSGILRGRWLNKGTKSRIQTLAHYRFRTTLKHQSWGKCAVREVNEAYTSKTCTQCGNIHAKLG